MQFENEKFVKVPGQNVVLVRLQIPAGMSLVVSDLIQDCVYEKARMLGIPEKQQDHSFEALDVLTKAASKKPKKGMFLQTVTREPALQPEIQDQTDISTLIKESIISKSETVDLSDYAKTIKSNLDSSLDSLVLSHVSLLETYLSIATDLSSCDSILDEMGVVLSAFQQDLFKISDEIETLQISSGLLATRLKNRRDLEAMLKIMLDGLVISSDLVKKIFEAEITEFFIIHLGQVDSKMSFVREQQNNSKEIKAIKEVGPELERLRLRATEKIRDFFLKRIATLKTPNTNISVIQQSYFLKYNQLFWFLIDRHSEAATEIKITYVNTVSAYYKYQFDKYLKSVSKMANVIADNLDLIGYDENIRKGNLFNQKIVFRPNVFTLGDRNSVLNTEAGIILGNQNSENQNQKYPYEATFKSLHRLFFDNGSSEFIFSTCFFSSPGIKAKSDLALATVIFNEIFEETIKLVVSHSKQSIEQSFDAVGLLLCIRINSQNQMIMQKRKIPCFDNYINGINLLLWPRFQTVMDMHIESLKRQNASKLITLKDLTNPHYIIRRYAEFCVSIISLNQGYDDELLTNSLTRLRTEVLVLLHKMSSELTLRKTRSVFLINNFDLVLSIIGEHNGDLFDLEKIHFQELMQVKTSEYVELELDPHFGGLITFITSHEKSKVVDIDAGKFEKVTSEFNGGWKNGINAINSSVIQLFPNFQNGARILHTVLTQLLIYYKRYLEMNEVRFDKASKRSVYPIGLQAVMVEIKKFKSLV